MAKGAAAEKQLGGLHSALTRVFSQLLMKYEKQLIAIETLNPEQVSEDMLEVLMELGEPNPAMLGAISKFLKDNSIMYDSEEVDKLSSQARRLKELKAKRGGNVVSLTDVPAVADG